MTATTFQTRVFQNQVEPKKTLRPISWETFEKSYLSREDAWKYEWVNGIVEKTERTMNQQQLYILFNLRKLFSELGQTQKKLGVLETEIDAFFLERVHRRPDKSYFSLEQLTEMAEGKNQIPAFVIEIISTNDKARKVQKKMKNYRDAKVQVVWQIYPDLEEVHVYKGEDMTICSGDKICSAAPALPDFRIATKNIFLKQPKT